jgi:YgiT-type zinc finger domain-containing protein
MQCSSCRCGDLFQDKIEVKHKDGGFTYIVDDIPVFVCWNCGQQFFKEDVKQSLEKDFQQSCTLGESVVRKSYVDWSGRFCSCQSIC